MGRGKGGEEPVGPLWLALVMCGQPLLGCRDQCSYSQGICLPVGWPGCLTPLWRPLIFNSREQASSRSEEGEMVELQKGWADRPIDGVL